MNPMHPVDFESAGSEEGGQFTRGIAALKIHLEESILAVSESQAEGDIGTAPGVDREQALLVAMQADRGFEPGDPQFPVQQGQAATEP
jgi:hypothetical protein